MAGRYQLVKSTLLALGVSWNQAFELPVSNQIERYAARFLAGAEGRRPIFVAWNDICKPKKAGGLGIHRLQICNAATRLRLCWKLITSNFLWSKWIAWRYFKL